MDGQPRCPKCAVIRLISCKECLTRASGSNLCRLLYFQNVNGGLFFQQSKRFRLMNIRHTRIYLLVSILSKDFIPIQPAVEILCYGPDSTDCYWNVNTAIYCKDLEKWSVSLYWQFRAWRESKEALKRVIFFQSLAHIFCLLLWHRAKRLSCSSSSFILRSFLFVMTMIMTFISYLFIFWILRKCIIDFFHVFCDKKKEVLIWSVLYQYCFTNINLLHFV